jgi:hypothetical protein
MTWVRLDDGFAEHEKILGLSDRAFRLHVAALCYSARNLTEGVISELALRSVGANANLSRPKSTASTLVTAGLWEKEGDGFRIHDYLDYNPAKADVERERQQARDRMRHRRSQQKDASGSGERSGERSGTPSRPQLKPSHEEAEDRDRRAHACPHCPLRFASQRELDAHLDVVHWVAEPPAAEGRP